MSHIDPDLRDMLVQRGEGVRVTGDLAVRAVARDRSNRRRSRGTAALAIGLVLAVGLPVGWGVLRSRAPAPLPVAPSTSTPDSPSPTGTPTQSSTDDLSPSPSGSTAPDGRPTSTPTATGGAAPEPARLRPATGDPTSTTNIPYLVDGVIHDGATTVRLQETGHEGPIARLAGGRWLVVGTQSVTTLVVDADGTTLVTLPGWAVVADDGALFVIEDVDGNLRAHDSSGRLVATLPASTCDCGSGSDPGRYTPIGIVGSVVYANRGARDAAVAWDVVTGSRRAVQGRVELVNTVRRTALMAAPVPGSGLCHELRDLVTGRTSWRFCGPLSFRSFSSDGAYLLATGWIEGLSAAQRNPDGSYRYGTLVVVRASDAAVVLDSGGRSAAGTAVTYRMGDDGALTVQVGFPAGTRDLQRCTLEGSCEVVAPALPRLQADVPMGDDPYYLSVN